ncbi:MAG TPA: DUF4148 domain-containing protein [Trinickia sp.]|jgi:hypothetical protein|uniref:DUF4148 domain-containing protein n=1 Tax=Trinickia sp. TaxID=2571163 RepID=UPI002CD786F8|nr:DUF4148 domain-containing protein [Trinickia sp.]HTI18303.1 DUF4148 domain-containing protein [Trinickia sp.]
MKTFVPALVIASALVAPTFAMAQTNGPVTRAQVQSELVALQSVGYNPVAAHTQYPKDIQAAEARLAAKKAASGYGGVVGGTAESGVPAMGTRIANDGLPPLYFGG